MRIIIGLGNPGKQYEWTRHNVGWIVLDALLEYFGSETMWEKHHKAKALIAKIQIKGEDVLLAKPQTYMNNSGDAVQALLAFHKTAPSEIVVVHDDVDIEFGEYKVATDSGAAGHNGVRSIIGKLGTKEFTRLRVGIKSDKKGKISTEKFVLMPFGFFEKRNLKKMLPEIIRELEGIL